MHDLTDDLALVTKLATIADELTMKYFRTKMTWRTKRDGSPVTVTDEVVERALIDEIRLARPQDSILGEETGTHGEGRRQWVIDPIDHTRHYLRGDPEFGTLISLIEDFDVRVALVTAPALNHRWWAATGMGAWKDGNSICVSKVERLSEVYLSMAGFREWNERQSGVNRLLGGCAYVTGSPGGFRHALRVAEGAIDAFIEPWGQIWDHIGVSLIVREAGGRATTLSGAEPRGGSLVVTSGTIHDQILEFLR